DARVELLGIDFGEDLPGLDRVVDVDGDGGDLAADLCAELDRVDRVERAAGRHRLVQGALANGGRLPLNRWRLCRAPLPEEQRRARGGQEQHESTPTQKSAPAAPFLQDGHDLALSRVGFGPGHAWPTLGT